MTSGSFSDRFEPALGYNFYFGKQTSENWRWSGKFEYMKFDKQNDEASYIKAVNEGKEYIYNLPENFMEFTAYGLSANADYKVFSSEILNGYINFCFGIYNWKFNRSAYSDSLYDNNVLIFTANLPENSQSDWSGGFNVGVNADLNIYGPLFLNLGANYKAIIGELWPALAIDMENVSTFQMFDIKASISIKF